MKPSTRWIVLAAGVLAAAGLFLLVRPEGSPEGPASPAAATSAPTASDGSPEVPTGSQTPASPQETVAVIRVTVRGGDVDAPREPTVKRGERVRIVVDADVTDEIHLHGYDRSAEVRPGRPGVLTFRADAPGVFEVELEDAGLLLFELTVEP